MDHELAWLIMQYNSCQLRLCYYFHNIGKWPLFQNNLGEPVPKSLEVKLFWILMRQTMTGFGDGSGISQTIYKQFALCSNQVTMPTPHHPIFTIRISSWRPTTMLKHWKQLQRHREEDITLHEYNLHVPSNKVCKYARTWSSVPWPANSTVCREMPLSSNVTASLYLIGSRG